jgi:hypothetical protein
MKPNCNNACSGTQFQDWLEVNLTPVCNASCEWCVEKRGWHPQEKASWETIVEAAIQSGKKNIILLGGEPTLHKNLFDIIEKLVAANLNVWITTNGSMLTRGFAEKLRGIKGVNISCHHYDLGMNEMVTGVMLSHNSLIDVIQMLHKNGAIVRMNCNCIEGYIDSKDDIQKYIRWAKSIGADGIRFAELKFSNEFIDLAKVFKYQYGLNDNPFVEGCWKDTVIDDMPVNFRQMCGIQTSKRPMPENPEQVAKEVLYYDGKLYDGWQVPKEKNMRKAKNLDVSERLAEIARLMLELAKDIKESGKHVEEEYNDEQFHVDLKKANKHIGAMAVEASRDYAKGKTEIFPTGKQEKEVDHESGGGCVY